MNESAQHHVLYEEILHAIAMDAHACGAEPWNGPPSSPDHIDQPITSCSHPPLACATQEHSNRKPRSSRMNEKSQINATILRQLFETKAIRLEPGAIFDYELVPKKPDFDFERVEDMLLGAAIGDSLGNTSGDEGHAGDEGQIFNLDYRVLSL